MDASIIIEVDDALCQFEDLGGQITTFSPFGDDPLRQNPELISRREVQFRERYPNFDHFFHTIVNADNSWFREGILYLIDISRQLEAYI